MFQQARPEVNDILTKCLRPGWAWKETASLAPIKTTHLRPNSCIPIFMYKNKDTPPAMTPRNFTFFPAAQSSVLQPFQGFVTFAFWHDLHFHWYLHDFVVVFMNLQWSKHSIFVPIQKKTKFLYFSLASLCQRAKFFQSCKSFNPHTISNVTTCDVATIPEISTA